MPSGKRARQQRREAATKTPPPVRSKGGGGIRAPRQASPRVLAIGGGVAAIAAIVIVLAIVLSGGGNSSLPSATDLQGMPSVGSATSPVALAGAVAANNLFKGIPQNGFTLGKPNAPVEMQMFIDVQCPICQNYELNYLPTIIKKYIRTGEVQLNLQPWAFLGPQSFTGRLGLIAAAFQNKAFEYAKVLYDNQGQEESGWLSGREMAFIAASVTGLNMQKWLTDTNGSDAKKIADTVTTLAHKVGAEGTPTVLVGPTGGKLQFVVPAKYAPNLKQTEAALNKAIRGA